MADDWRTPDAEALFEAILSLEDTAETERFFRDLCTLNELRDMAQRWAVVRLLDSGQALRRDLARDRRQHGDDHAHRLVAEPRRGRLSRGPRADEGRHRAMRERLRLAVPNKGRLVEPTLRLLHDAGLVFEEHDRSLVARVQNFDLDILFVRTNDIIEFVGDGVADLGITGHRPADRDRRRAAARPRARLRPLPAGRRRPDRRAPADRRGPGRPAGRDGPPEHGPPLLRGSRGIAVDVIPISGAVEVAPRLGLAEGIVDLVSTGSTLVMNGLRQIGDVLASEAVLVANPTADRERSAELAAIDTMLSAVIAARGRKYLMMNAPAAALPELEGLLPALESPTVIPLAHEGMIAIHSVVGADEVWGLLPRLKAAGASGILVLPIEKIVP